MIPRVPSLFPASQEAQLMTRYHGFLLLAFIAVWTWAAIKPRYPHDWLLENYLVFVFVPVILLTGCYFRLSSSPIP